MSSLTAKTTHLRNAMEGRKGRSVANRLDEWRESLLFVRLTKDWEREFSSCTNRVLGPWFAVTGPVPRDLAFRLDKALGQKVQYVSVLGRLHAYLRSGA